jgi:hypothetical protein
MERGRASGLFRFLAGVPGAETIKQTDRPYFVLDGNVCALFAAKDHVNLFLYELRGRSPTAAERRFSATANRDAQADRRQ